MNLSDRATSQTAGLVSFCDADEGKTQIMARVAKIEEQEEVKFTPSSGNVFQDLGLDNPEDLLQKSCLISVVDAVIKKRRLSQVKAAEKMGISQPDLSKLLRGRSAGFSLERLFSMLVSLGVSTHITFEIPAKFAKRGRIVVDELHQSLELDRLQSA